MNSSRKFEEKILELTHYNKELKNKKILTASTFTSDDLQLYYRYKYGSLDRVKIDSSTLGSIFHLGLEQLSRFENILTEISSSIPYKGWELSCTTDYIDMSNKEIRDFKLTKKYTYKKFSQDGAYAWQLRFNKYVLSKIDSKYRDYKMYVSMFIKDAEETFKDKEMDSLVHVIVDEVTDREIEFKISSKIDILTQLLNGEMDLKECKDLWWRNKKVNGKNIKVPMRCEKYCSYRDLCKFYKRNNNPIDDISSWL